MRWWCGGRWPLGEVPGLLRREGIRGGEVAVGQRDVVDAKTPAHDASEEASVYLLWGPWTIQQELAMCHHKNLIVREGVIPSWFVLSIMGE